MGIGPRSEGGFGLDVGLKVALPGIERVQAVNRKFFRLAGHGSRKAAWEAAALQAYPSDPVTGPVGTSICGQAHSGTLQMVYEPGAQP